MDLQHSIMLTTYGVVAIFSAVLSFLVLRFWRVHHRADLRDWGRAWMCMSAHHLCAGGAMYASVLQPSPPGLAMGLSLISMIAGMWVIGLLCFGSFHLALGRGLSPSIRLPVLLILTALGVAMSLTTESSSESVRQLVRVGALALMIGIAFQLAAWTIWRQRRGQPATKDVGRLLLFVAFTLYAIDQFHYFISSLCVMFLRVPLPVVPYSGIIDVALIAFMGLSLMIWLLEDQQHRVLLALDERQSSERRYRQLFEQAGDAILVHDDQGRVLDANRHACALLRPGGGELRGRNLTECDGGWAQRMSELTADNMPSGHPQTAESVFTRPGANPLVLEVSSSLVEVDGRHCVLAMLRDVTERRRADHHRRIILNELDHRVKNNMASVLSLAQQTLRSSSTMEQFRSAFVGRITAMAHAHALLAQARWEAVGVADTARQVLRPFLNDDFSRLHLRGEPTTLPAWAALPMSLVLHELATNAMKYGSLSVESGTVDLEWSVDGERNFMVRWIERNGPPVKAAASAGTGTSLIEGFIRFELRGLTAFNYPPAGANHSLQFPLHRPDLPTRDAAISTDGLNHHGM